MTTKILLVLTLNSFFINAWATYSQLLSSNPSVIFVPPTSSPPSTTDKYHYYSYPPIKQYATNYHSIAPIKSYSALNKGISTQYHTQDSLGQYSYGYSTANGIEKNEARSADGTVVGSYSYVSPEGQQVVVKYTAGEGGFQPTGNVLPQQVEPTPEVAKATYEHFLAKAEAEALNARQYQYPEYQYPSYPYAYDYPARYEGYTAYNNYPYLDRVASNIKMDRGKMLHNYKFNY